MRVALQKGAVPSGSCSHLNPVIRHSGSQQPCSSRVFRTSDAASSGNCRKPCCSRRRIADSAAGPGQGAPDVLLVAPPPITEAGWLAEMFAGGAEVSRALGPALRALAEARGVGFFDAGGVIGTDPLDGVHFSAEAHLTLGAAMADAVRARAG